MPCGYNIEQGRATCYDEVTHLNLRRSLVWHRLSPSAQSSSIPATTSQAPSRGPRRTGNQYVAFPGDRACIAFNQGACNSNAGHPADLHVCSYCLKTAHGNEMQHTISSDYTNTFTSFQGCIASEEVADPLLMELAVTRPTPNTMACGLASRSGHIYI